MSCRVELVRITPWPGKPWSPTWGAVLNIPLTTPGLGAGWDSVPFHGFSAASPRCKGRLVYLPSVPPLLLVTVGVVLCWRSPHSHTVKLYKYSFINDSLALCLYSGTVWGVLGMPVFLRGAGSDHAGGPNLVREPFCGKEFLYVPLEALSFFRSWDSSLCSSGSPEFPLAAEHCQGYSRVRWFLGVLKVWCNKKVCVDFGEVLCAIAPRYYIFCLQID